MQAIYLRYQLDGLTVSKDNNYNMNAGKPAAWESHIDTTRTLTRTPLFWGDSVSLSGYPVLLQYPYLCDWKNKLKFIETNLFLAYANNHHSPPPPPFHRIQYSTLPVTQVARAKIQQSRDGRNTGDSQGR